MNEKNIHTTADEISTTGEPVTTQTPTAQIDNDPTAAKLPDGRFWLREITSPSDLAPSCSNGNKRCHNRNDC